MAKFIQVLNGEVVNHWDIPSTLPSPVGTDGWFTTVEIIPEIQEGRQTYGVYTYDTTKDPVVISREVIDIPFEQRKKDTLLVVQQRFLQWVEVMQKDSRLYTNDDIQTNKKIAEDNKNLVLAAETHDDLDNIVLIEQKLF